MIRVGLVLSVSWLGSVNYYRNLLNALYSLPERRIEPVLFTGRRIDPGLLVGFPPCAVVRSPWFDGSDPRRRARKLWYLAFTRDPVLARSVQRHNIQALSHGDLLAPRSPIPTICWLGDFQHRRLPELFTPRERRYRDRDFLLKCRFATRLVVSSRDAQRGLAEFSPESVPKSRVLQFVAQPGIVAKADDLPGLENRYGFTGPYFHVPNQFWSHKNHRVIVDALRILKERGTPVLVIATGDTHDYRQPRFFADLMDYAERSGITDQLKVLGLIPYADVAHLMHHARALINPSHFEGWSTSVEEAKSIGKRIILSDIPVHREQAPPGGIYFDPDDANALADILGRTWSSQDRAEDGTLMERARAALPGRVRAYAETYEAIIMESVGRCTTADITTKA